MGGSVSNNNLSHFASSSYGDTFTESMKFRNL